MYRLVKNVFIASLLMAAVFLMLALLGMGTVELLLWLVLTAVVLGITAARSRPGRISAP